MTPPGRAPDRRILRAVLVIGIFAGAALGAVVIIRLLAN